MKSFIRNNEIEHRAEEVIALYERKCSIVVRPPVPIEEIVMQVLGLTVGWDELDDVEGFTILGGLHPEKRTIVLNLGQRELFESVQGLERSTIGHEAGHWEYDIDKSALGHPKLFDQEPSGPYTRSLSKKYGSISVFRGNLWSRESEANSPKHNILDSPEQRRVVNRFAAALSMPRYLLKEVVKEADVLSWPGMYKIQKQFDVSITALKIRLEQLGYNYYDGKRFHRNKAEALGQESLGL